MKLTPDTMKAQLWDLDQRRRTLYSRWQTWLNLYTQTFTFNAPTGFDQILPGTARRIVDIIARMLYQDLHIHCPPAGETQKAQDAADKREKALQAQVDYEESLAALEEAAPPLEAAAKYVTLFGGAVDVTALDERALQPEPERRKGESVVDHEMRVLAWRRAKARSYPLRDVIYPPMYAMRHPDTGHCFVRHRVATSAVEDIGEEYGSSIPPDVSPAPTLAEDQLGRSKGTVLWEEGWSDDRHIIVVGQNYDDPLLDGRHYLGFTPFSFARPTTGMPGVIWMDVGDGQGGTLALGPEGVYAGVLAGLESVLVAQARRLTQLDANISLNVWQSPDVFLAEGKTAADLGYDWRYYPFGEPNIIETHTIRDIRWRNVPQLGADIYKTLELYDALIEMSSSARLLAGVRQAGTSSAYEEQILVGLAAGVLRPYTRALERLLMPALQHRLMYVQTPFFPDGLEYRGQARKGWVAGRLKETDIDSYDLQVKITTGMPYDDERAQQRVKAAMDLGLMSRRRAAEEGFRIEDPDEEWTQRAAEDMLMQALEAKKQEIFEEYSPEMAEALRQTRLTEVYGQMEGQGRGQPGLAQRGAAIPGTPTAPPAAGSPEEADLILRQAQLAARGGMPTPRGT